MGKGVCVYVHVYIGVHMFMCECVVCVDVWMYLKVSTCRLMCNNKSVVREEIYKLLPIRVYLRIYAYICIDLFIAYTCG